MQRGLRKDEIATHHYMLDAVGKRGGFGQKNLAAPRQIHVLQSLVRLLLAVYDDLLPSMHEVSPSNYRTLIVYSQKMSVRISLVSLLQTVRLNPCQTFMRCVAIATGS